jgi:23S rRNA pseudouridine2605 synthase
MTPVPGVESVRVNRLLAERGVASRRAADRLVDAGRVRLNGRPAVPGTLVDPGRDVVTVDGRPLPPPLARRTVMLNKPAGVVSTRHDPQGRRTVLDLVDEAHGLFPVGRLDSASRGLILLSSDGELALRLTHPRHGVVKRYLVTVRGRAGERVLRALRHGVELEDGWARAAEAELRERGRDGDVIELAMSEGRKREVRRLCAAVGAPALDLVRIAIGPQRLGRLREGSARRLTATEEQRLYGAVGLTPPARSRVHA